MLRTFRKDLTLEEELLLIQALEFAFKVRDEIHYDEQEAMGLLWLVKDSMAIELVSIADDGLSEDQVWEAAVERAQRNLALLMAGREQTRCRHNLSEKQKRENREQIT